MRRRAQPRRLALLRTRAAGRLAAVFFAVLLREATVLALRAAGFAVLPAAALAAFDRAAVLRLATLRVAILRAFDATFRAALRTFFAPRAAD